MHAFNPSIVEEYKTGGDRSQLSLILRFLEAGSPFQSEIEVRTSGWLLCFSDLQVKLHYLSLGFYYSCYNSDIGSFCVESLC